MPRRLLREPHILAHELRTPLAILAGWSSLVFDNEVRPGTTEWAKARAACEEAVARLNVIISEACGEAEALNRMAGHDHRYIGELLDRATRAIARSEIVRAQLEQARENR